MKEAVLVRRVARALGAIVMHQGIETRRQAFDVAVRIVVSFPSQQTARVGQATNHVFVEIFADVFVERRSAGIQSAAEPGMMSGHHMNCFGVPPWEGAWRDVGKQNSGAVWTASFPGAALPLSGSSDRLVRNDLSAAFFGVRLRGVPRRL
ncbi:MAG: hypothetical protein OXN84_07655 [Albidovulum sp.]|nr:hypothetical protein [Albidovulum sp.]